MTHLKLITSLNDDNLPPAPDMRQRASSISKTLPNFPHPVEVFTSFILIPSILVSIFSHRQLLMNFDHSHLHTELLLCLWSEEFLHYFHLKPGCYCKIYLN